MEGESYTYPTGSYSVQLQKGLEGGLETLFCCHSWKFILLVVELKNWRHAPVVGHSIEYIGPKFNIQNQEKKKQRALFQDI